MTVTLAAITQPESRLPFSSENEVNIDLERSGTGGIRSRFGTRRTVEALTR